jgi:hypothetical protein
MVDYNWDNGGCRSCKGPLKVLEENETHKKVECGYCGDVYNINKPNQKGEYREKVEI